MTFTIVDEFEPSDELAEALYTIGVENPRTGNELVATMAAALQGRLVVTITPATGMAAWSNA